MNNESGKIPFIIHQMWYDKSGKDTCPDRYIENIENIKRICSNFEYIFWNNSMINELWEDNRLDRWKNAFYKLEHHIEKCDFTRYAILYLYGGVYIDLDFYINKDISPLIKDKDLLLCEEPVEHENTKPTPITNGVTGGHTSHIFFYNLMNYIRDNYSSSHYGWMDILKYTGPIALSNVYHSGNYSPLTDYCYITPITYHGYKPKLCDNYDPYMFTKWTEGIGWWCENGNCEKGTEQYEEKAKYGSSWYPYIILAIGIILSLLAIILF
jgi:mannosyltransferase OCH1-like enzyme